MNRSTVTVAVIAVLGVLAIGLVAGSISSPAVLDDSGGGGLVPGEGDGIFPVPDSPDGGAGALTFAPWFARLVLLLATFGILLGLVYILFNPRVLLLLVGLLIVVTILATLLGDLGIGGGPGFDPQQGDTDGTQTPGTSQTDRSPLNLFWAVVPLLGLLVVTVGLVYLSTRREDDGDPEEQLDGEEGVPDQGKRTALAGIAGRTADRIEAGDGTAEALENEIYEAWHEMTRELSVTDPDSTTPGEFARVARTTGLDSEAVAELTRLFEDVRYGGHEPTQDREQRAVTVLRRIERTKSLLGSDTASGTDAATGANPE